MDAASIVSLSSGGGCPRLCGRRSRSRQHRDVRRTPHSSCWMGGSAGGEPGGV